MSDHPTPVGHLSAEYLRYMGSLEWAEVRIRYFRSRARRCQGRECGVAGQVDLHHRTYANFGHEHLSDLVALCRACHELVHRLQRERDVSVWNATLAVVPRRPQRKKTKRRVGARAERKRARIERATASAAETRAKRIRGAERVRLVNGARARLREPLY